MPSITIPENYRLVTVPPFVALGVEGATPHSAAELIKIYRERGNIQIDFDRVLKRSYCEFFKLGFYEPDVFVGTYAKFDSFTRRNPDSIIMTGIGESALETMISFMDDLKQVVGLEVKTPTKDFVDDMATNESQQHELVGDTDGISLREQVQWYRERVKAAVHK